MARLADSARRKRPSGTSSPWETCHAHTKSLQWCPTLRGPTDCSPAGRSVHGTLQAGMLEGLPGPPSGGLSDPGTEPASLGFPALAAGFFSTGATWGALRSFRFLSEPNCYQLMGCFGG